MATKAERRESAERTRDALQQVGSGWWVLVGEAVKRGDHKDLGLERREYVATIGQAVIDPREAIVELFNEGHSQEAIADILGVSPDRTVRRVLTEEGLLKPTPRMIEASSGGKVGVAET